MLAAASATKLLSAAFGEADSVPSSASDVQAILDALTHGGNWVPSATEHNRSNFKPFLELPPLRLAPADAPPAGLAQSDVAFYERHCRELAAAAATVGGTASAQGR